MIIVMMTRYLKGYKMKRINLNTLIDEVVSTNKKVDKHNKDNNEKKEKTTLADAISKNMLENTKNYKDE